MTRDTSGYKRTALPKATREEAVERQPDLEHGWSKKGRDPLAAYDGPTSISEPRDSSRLRETQTRFYIPERRK